MGILPEINVLIIIIWKSTANIANFLKNIE